VVGDDAVDVLQVVYTGAVNVDACLFFHVCVVGSLSICLLGSAPAAGYSL
jgi:hypothetical protein